MSTAYEIPLRAIPQSFTITLGGTPYDLTVRWNAANATWIVDFYSTSGVLILGGVPLVANVDLLAQYGYLEFGGKLVAQTDFDVTAPPTFANLGTTGHLYFVVD